MSESIPLGDNPWGDSPSTSSSKPAATSSARSATHPGTSMQNPISIDDPPDHAPPAYTAKPSTASTNKAATTQNVQSTGMEHKNEMLLLAFIHGFKGSSETTFEDFPSRLTHNLQETYPGLHVKSLVYPTYDTRGSLNSAVEGFVEWLTEQTVKLESKPEMDKTGQILPSGKGGGLGSVKIVLAGHSMGGLVAVDAALAIAASSQSQKGPTATALPKLWPRVVGVLAYDSPYYGVHPGVFKNGINKYAGYIQTAQNWGTFLAPMGVGLAARWNSERQSAAQQTQQKPGQSGDPSRSRSAPPPASQNGSAWSSMFTAAGKKSDTDSSSSATSPTTQSKASSNWRNALLATGAVALASGAAASAAYFNKDKLNGAYSWVTDHLAFVSNLWDDAALRQRLDKLVEQPQILFHCFYTRLPATSKAANPTNMPVAPRDRTFIILPPRTATCASSFTAMDNTQAADEVDAHISMFSAKNNPRYFDLGLRTAGLIATCLDNESRYGDQRHAQSETRDWQNGNVEEEKGLRDGDEEIEILKASNDQEFKAKQESQ